MIGNTLCSTYTARANDAQTVESQMYILNKTASSAYLSVSSVDFMSVWSFPMWKFPFAFARDAQYFDKQYI